MMKINDFKLERYFSAYEFTAPYLLCSSDCESFTVAEILALEEGAAGKLYDLRLGYTETMGDPGLRDEIAGLYQTVSSDDIIVFAGAAEGIFIAMNVLLEKGDHAVVQYPCYQSLFEVTEAIGCEVSRWPMREEKSWEPDISFLDRCINDRTRAIIINSPHNPTGYHMQQGMLMQIVEKARENNCILFSDEVYRDLEYNAARPPAACDCYENGVSLGVMSKSLGLAGLRIGWIACRNRKLLKRMASFKDYTTICCSAPSELLSAIALRQRPVILQRNLSIIRANLSLLRSFFDRCSFLFSWVEPAAGPVAFPAFSGTGGVEAFCSELMQQKGVLLLPGTCYGYDDRHFRIGFGRRNMPEALSRLEEFIDDRFPGS